MARQQQGRGLGETVTAQDTMDKRNDGLAACLGIAAALEDTCRASLQAEGKAVETDVGPCLKDDANHAKRHTDTSEFQPVGQYAMLQFPP